jgi:PEP-CTERM motif
MTERTPLRLMIGLSVSLCIVAPANAALITFSDRLLFNAAAPGLPVETFEAGLVASGAVTVCAGPLSGATANACFPAGGLLPGVVYSASPGTGMVLLGPGFPPLGNASKVLGPNAFVDVFDLTFAASNVVGLDVFPGLVAGNVLVSVFDSTNMPLGAFTIAAPLGGTFFGVATDTGGIGRLRVASAGPIPGELVDNVAFGTAQISIPEPTTMMLLAVGLASAWRRVVLGER